jgi:hypothetical protein
MEKMKQTKGNRVKHFFLKLWKKIKKKKKNRDQTKEIIKLY